MSFTQDLSHMCRDMAGITAAMDPLIAKDTNFKRGYAGAVGLYFWLGPASCKRPEVEVYEIFVKRLVAFSAHLRNPG